VSLRRPGRDTPVSDVRIEDLLRQLAPRVLGVVMRRFGGLDGAEDATQEALLAAARHWPVSGIPDSPLAWLVQAASRRLTDQIRGDEARRRREVAVAGSEPPPAEVPGGDDTLILMFMCCHPVLTPPSAIALTLRAVGGLTTAEIAHAFGVPEATMAQRISRAKQRVKASRVPFQVPAEAERAGRLNSVLHVLYLIYNEGYVSTSGAKLFRQELSGEAIRLTRVLRQLLPGDGQVTGLLALMILTEARRPARTGPAGELVPLAEQDRTLWDASLIGEGVTLAVEAMAAGPAGEYQLQAAIAALHDEADRAEETDWPQILALYGILERVSGGNPMVSLNRAVAAAMVHGPVAGLALLEPLGASLGGHYRLHAVRGHLFEMLGDHRTAFAAYNAAASGTRSVPERNYLTAKAAQARQNMGRLPEPGP
jgi:RNA polymerase sigma factor (sigma-70 family)